MGKAVALDEGELFLRLIEIGIKAHRRPGASNAELIAEFEVAAMAGEIPAYIITDFKDMARAACQYFAECVAASKAVH